MSAFYGLAGTETVWEGIPVFPAVCRPNTYGFEMIPHFYRKWDADVVIILADAWVGEQYSRDLASLNVANWIPIDSSPLSLRDKTALVLSESVPIAMSQFGKAMLEGDNFRPLYMPHAVDTDVFRPADPEARRAIRAELGADDDTTIIGMNAANRDLFRKGFFEQFEAFGRYHEANPNSLLYVHTTINHPQGLDLASLTRSCGIDKAVIFPDQDVVVSGAVTQEMLVRNFYDLLDVYSCCSLAEGFGIPIIEAQACGIPVVVTDGSSMTELCGPWGHQVKGDPMWVEGHRARWTKPRVDGIVSAYTEATRLQDEANPAEIREFAQGYSEQQVADTHLKTVLDALEVRYGR